MRTAISQPQAASRQAAPLHVSYVPVERVHELECPLLAVIHHTRKSPSFANTLGQLVIPVEPLGAAFAEVWCSRTAVESNHDQDITFSRSKDVLFAYLRIAEHAFGDLDAVTYEAYQRIYAFTRRQGYPHLLRVWNFLPAINEEQGGIERYQAFCRGRHLALEQFATASSQLPAASAIGTHAASLHIYFLAARESGIQVENPRQVSAFDYPPRYSPKSPSFSRAVVKHWGEETHLYISGTASIVGHETRHARDTLAQLDETLNNLEALVRHAGRSHGLRIDSVRDLNALKVYVRNPTEAENISARMTQRLGGEIPVMLLHGDICRADLRLEIEGSYADAGPLGCDREK